MPRCSQEAPLLQIVNKEKEHRVACHLLDEGIKQRGELMKKTGWMICAALLFFMLGCTKSITEYNPDGSVKRFSIILGSLPTKVWIRKNSSILPQPI